MFKKIKELILKGDFTTAEKIAENDLFLLSLVYRAQFKYGEELETLNKLSKEDPKRSYINERLNWHNLPIDKKMVHKKPFRSDRIEIGQDIIDQTIFILACDSNPIYFNLALECIDSLLCITEYESVPIFMIDLGLSDQDKSYLKQKSNRIIVSDLDKEINKLADFKNKSEYLKVPINKTVYTRFFANELFEEFRYLFFIDIDGWIQDAFAIDQYLDSSIKQGVGCCCNFEIKETKKASESLFHPVFKRKPLIVSNIKYSCLGLICLDKTNFPFKEYQDYFFKYHFENPSWGGFDEKVFNYIVNTSLKIKFMDKNTHYYRYMRTEEEKNLFLENCLINNGSICSNDQKFLGFIHFQGRAKDCGFLKNSVIIEKNMSKEEILNHPNIFKNVGSDRGEYPNKIFYSPHFYQYPKEEEIVLDLLDKSFVSSS